MSKILFYKMTSDSGFAPNPFWGYLTLATCTPNHMRANLEKGDWIVGVESKTLAKYRIKAGIKPNIKLSIIYIAKLTENPMTLTEYFIDKRFEKKKYSEKNWKTKNGDNVYFCENGTWKWLKKHVHDKGQNFFNKNDFSSLWSNYKNTEKKSLYQDIKGNKVFVSKEFTYFGDKCIPIPKEFLPWIPNRGIKYCYSNNPESRKLLTILNTLMKQYGFGQIGNPTYNKIKKFYELQKNVRNKE